MCLKSHGFLPFAIGSCIAIPGSQPGQFVGTLIEIVTGVATHPFKNRRNFTTVEQHAIQRPQVTIRLHLVNTLGNLDSILTVAVNF